ncbi:MAG: hypothetical protein HYY03_08705 [Chloroflexi bacterium]|nr:hypothetical protein [Chloroflexota bacterium]
MLWVGQFGIVDGEAREHTPWVGTFPDPSPGEEPSDLYLIVEPALPGSEEFCAELAQAIGRVFHQRKASLTGGILRALRAAHENLRDWNHKSLKEHRVAAGVSCLALRGHEAYLAQVAPASAVLYRQRSLRTLEPALPDAAEPLGLYDDFWPDYSRFELAEGDRVLLLSPPLARSLPAEELAAALALPAEEALPAFYRQARSLPNCGAVLVAALPAAP